MQPQHNGLAQEMRGKGKALYTLADTQYLYTKPNGFSDAQVYHLRQTRGIAKIEGVPSGRINRGSLSQKEEFEPKCYMDSPSPRVAERGAQRQ